MTLYIHSATVVVSDQAAALDFYTDKLGWEKVLDVPMGDEARFITVRPAGTTTQLALGLPGWLGEGKQPGGPTGISLTSPDIDAAYNELSKRGVKFKGPVETMPWGGQGTWFYDLDGNEFFLASE